MPLAARLHVRTSSTNPLINKAPKAKKGINELPENIYVSAGRDVRFSIGKPTFRVKETYVSQ